MFSTPSVLNEQILRGILQRLHVFMDIRDKDVCVCVCVSTRGVADRLWTMKTTGLGADLMALTASS